MRLRPSWGRLDGHGCFDDGVSEASCKGMLRSLLLRRPCLAFQMRPVGVQECEPSAARMLLWSRHCKPENEFCTASSQLDAYTLYSSGLYLTRPFAALKWPLCLMAVSNVKQSTAAIRVRNEAERVRCPLGSHSAAVCGPPRTAHHCNVPCKHNSL